LAADGRLIKFDIVVSDRPGGTEINSLIELDPKNININTGIAELTMEVAKSGASIKDIFHERAWLAANVYSVQLRVICETRSEQHVNELMETLSHKYKQVGLSLIFFQNFR
jgi:threonine dehydratase